MAMAVDHPPLGNRAEVDEFLKRLEGLLDAYLPELQADLGVDRRAATAGEPFPGDGELEAVLHRFAQAYPEQDWRAVVSVWSQWYLRTLWPPLVTAALGRACLPEARALDIQLTSDARPVRMRVTPGGLISAAPDELLDDLVRAHTAPMIERLAAAGGFSPRVLWSVVGAMTRWTLATLGERGVDFSLEPGERLLANDVFSDAAPNPLYGTQRPNAPEQRRVCCLRYRIDAMPYCADCPIAGGGR